MRDLLARAMERKYAVGYFESWDMRSLECVVSAAENINSPVIIGFGCTNTDPEWLRRYGIEYFARIGKLVGERARVPTSLLLNEANSFEDILTGLKQGFNCVMLDTCNLGFDQNVSASRRITDVAHPLGIDVEGELGRIPGPNRIERYEEDWLTDPEKARQYVEETHVDALAVSVGNIHNLSSGEATIDLPRLARIAENVDVPLVVHGGTGFPRNMVNSAIGCSVAKFNVGTVMKTTYVKGLLGTLCDGDLDKDVHTLIGPRPPKDMRKKACEDLVAKIEDLIRLFGGEGRSWI